MKRNHITATFAAAITFAFAACDKKPDPGAGSPAEPAKPAAVDEKTAIANFKSEVEGVTKWIEEKQKTVASDPTAAMSMMGEVVGKFKSIKTDGLPADLKGAWGEMTTVMGELGEVFKGMPTGQGGKPEDAMKALGEMMPKMMALQEKVAPIAKKLEEVGTKYGLDMSKVAPGK